MKKNNILLAISAILYLCSCSDYLDTSSKSTFDDKNIYSSVDLAEGAIMGIYVPFGETNSYRGRYLPWYGMNTDCEWYNSSEKYGDGKADLAVYATTPTNNQMNNKNNVWAKIYEGIECANLAIKGIREYGNPQPGNEMGHLLGEALTLRAVYYADLVKTWGDVPARFEPVKTATINIPKSDRDVIYKQIIADLEEASNLLYWPGDHKFTKTVNRINKAFAKGLRARICLNAAGYSQRPDSDTPRLSKDPELERTKLLTIAKKELLDIYGNSKAGKMEDSFESLFRKLCQENYAAGGESLWDIPFAEGRGRMGYTFAVKHNTADQYTALAQGGQVGPTPHFFYDYDVDDLRRDITCVPYEWSKSNPSKQELKSLNSWCFGKLRFEWMKRRVTSSNDDGLHKQYMRYAEIPLMLAEVTNELDGPSAAAPYLKDVRRRAFPAAKQAQKVEAYVNALNDKTKMFNAIVDEYAFEFAGEMLRKECLIRWNLLKTKLDESKQRMRELRDQAGRYSDVPSKVYFSYAADKESLILYGLNRGETADKSSEYDFFVEWVKPVNLKDEKIDAIYVTDPDKRQFWPIWEVFIANSNGQLINDYGY